MLQKTVSTKTTLTAIGALVVALLIFQAGILSAIARLRFHMEQGTTSNACLEHPNIVA